MDSQNSSIASPESLQIVPYKPFLPHLFKSLTDLEPECVVEAEQSKESLIVLPKPKHVHVVQFSYSRRLMKTCKTQVEDLVPSSSTKSRKRIVPPSIRRSSRHLNSSVATAVEALTNMSNKRLAKEVVEIDDDD